MEKLTTKEKVQIALDRLDEGIRDFYVNDVRYKEYLAAMSKLHHYSARNCILIERQHPGASMVAGYQDWKKNFNRQVKKGEKGIMILAPFKRSVEVDVPGKKDADGKQLKEKKDIVSFRPVYTFDVSQTEGDPIPELVHRLDFNVDGFEKIKNALIRSSGCDVIFEPMDEDSGINGFFNPMKNEIHIREGMSQAQTIKTILHESAHSILHPATLSDKTRQSKELEAESTAYVVSCWLFGEDGIDTGDYSFPYLVSWSQGKEIKELTECVENIKRASGILIDRLDQELGLERKPEEIRREELTNETKQIVEGAGVKADNVVIVAEQPHRMGRMVYVTNTDGTYTGVFFLHGETEQIEHLLTDKEAVIEDYPSYFEQNHVGCVIIPYSRGQTFDYWYNYETKELRKYPIAAEREVTAMVTVTGRSTEEQVMQLNDAAPLIVGNRVSFVGMDTDAPEGFIESADEVTTRFEHYDSSWPMVQIRYTNVSDRIPGEMNIYEFQKMIEKQPDKVLNDPAKYFKVCISYTYLDQNYQVVQDVDLGRGRVDYLNYLKMSGSHIAHLKRHMDLLKVCDAAKRLAPGTEYGMQYEDNVQEWAGYCRETLNHFSDKPMIPRPPELKSNEPIVSKDWRLAL